MACGDFKDLKRRTYSDKVLTDKALSIFILKTIHFILQNIFQSIHTSSSVVHIKSIVNIQIIRVCYNVTVSLKCSLKTFI